MAAKYELVLGKCHQEPCAKISVVLYVHESKYIQHRNFGKYNQCKNVITASGLRKLEALYKFGKV